MPTADANCSFPKSLRLKSSLLIKETVQQRHGVFCSPVKCFYLFRETPGESVAKVAFLVSKRRFAHAVDRNRVKRLLREAYRCHVRELQVVTDRTLLLCWMYVSDTLPTYEQVEKAVRVVFQKLSDEIVKAMP